MTYVIPRAARAPGPPAGAPPAAPRAPPAGGGSACRRHRRKVAAARSATSVSRPAATVARWPALFANGAGATCPPRAMTVRE